MLWLQAKLKIIFGFDIVAGQGLKKRSEAKTKFSASPSSQVSVQKSLN
jgi:hypothetical protein